jgi:hypothetical protein
MNLIQKCLLITLILTLSALPAWAQDDIDADTTAKMQAVEDAVVSLRGLEATAAVAREVFTPATLKDWLLERLTDEYPRQEARDDAIIYAAFDFMAPETDLWQLQLDLLTEQVGGFYDAPTGRMVIVAIGEGFDAIGELIYSHEFTHALQDQNFGLERLGLLDTNPDESADLILAHLALVEGDATLVMQDYLLWRVQEQGDAAFALTLFGGLSKISTTQLDNAPPIINAELTFPYLAGRSFVQAIFERGGWLLVNAVYERPPLSTEHILHPQRYLDADEPELIELRLPDAILSENWRLVRHSTLGEFYLREYLGQRLPDTDAALAAEGWGGDSFAVYYNERSSGILLIYRLRWDTLSHAREFVEAFTTFAEARYGMGPVADMEGLTCWRGAVRDPGGLDAQEIIRHDATCLRYGGRDTLIVQAPDLDTVIAVRDLQALGER